jgi:predicted permease
MRWFGKQRSEAAQEIHAHIEERIDELAESGMARAEAAQQAHREFGNAILLTESSREVWGWLWLDRLAQDLHYALRMLRRGPGLTAVAVLSLALGIGASSAIFSLVYAVLLDPYPYRDADRIIAPSFADKSAPGQGPKAERPRIFYTVPDFLDLERHSKTLEGAFLADFRAFIATGDMPEQVAGLAFSPNTFDFMGVPAMLGRTFTPADTPSPQAPPRLVVLSYLYWQKHFSGDPRAVGKQLELDHQPFTVIGVMPPRFTWGSADLYVPLAMIPDPTHIIPTMARIRPGLRLEAANAELQAMTERFAKRNPRVYPKAFRFQVQRLNDWLLGKFQGTLLILLVAVGFLLLIACGNVSILLLARAAVRQKEIAVRIALGAGRYRIVRQLLTESVLLSLAGGVIGVGLAYLGVPLLVGLMPEFSVPHEAAIQVNGEVVIFTFAIAVLTGILFGMAPAFQLVRADVRDAMQGTGRGFSGGTRAGKTRSALIVAEVALTMVLLVGAGIAIRGLVALTATHLGFDPSDVLMAQMILPRGAYKTPELRAARWSRVIGKIRTTPGIVAAAGTLNAAPPSVGFNADFEIPGRSDIGPDQKALLGLISDDYFSVLRAPILRGRDFSQAEIARSQRVGVINEAMLRRYWPDTNPIGVKIRIPALSAIVPPEDRAAFTADNPVEIVGVVATTPNRGLMDSPGPAIYLPWTVVPPAGGTMFLIRTSGDPHRLVNAIREQVRSEDPDQPLTQVMTLEEHLQTDFAYPRFSTTLFSIFAGVALLLASSGLYSVVSYVVARRTHEFGIRMALGARPADVVSLVAGMTARLIGVGIAVGLACSLALNRVTANYVAGWNPKDPVAFAAVIATLLGAALLAALPPARRAVSIQPVRALRHD